MTSLKASVSGVTASLMAAGVGGVGAVAVDVAMGQAAKFLPDSMTSRFTPEGNLNFGYYAAKSGLAIGAGILAQKFAPHNLRKHIAQGVNGSLTVQAYEMIRASLPAELLTLGYYSPAKVAGAARGNMGAYSRAALPKPASTLNRYTMSQPSGGGNIGSTVGVI